MILIDSPDLSDMSRLLDRMEKAGWVTRQRDERDRRQVTTHIMKSGTELLATLEKPTGNFVTPLFAGTTASDLKTVLKVNNRIRRRLP